jgi:hypothetical protein
MTTNPNRMLALALALVCSSCGDSPEAPVVTKSIRAQLQWKRNVALERDLMRALELPADGVCEEFGRDSCTRAVHHIALGGADPLSIGLYQPLPDTLVSTPIVFDRVVLSACSNRAQLDREAGLDAAVVFDALDLAAAHAPATGDDAFEQTIVGLYRRLLARDPERAEIDVLAELTTTAEGGPVSAYDFAVLACYSIGTTTEFLFF